MYAAVYITAKDREEATKIAGMLLKERLAGCVNIVPEIHSFYWWKGRIASHKESLLIAKAPGRNVKKIIAAVKKHHSYSVPCVNALPIIEGNPDYFRWLEDSTKKKKNEVK